MKKRHVLALALAVTMPALTVNAKITKDEKINYLKTKGLVAGYSATDLGLDKNLKRAELTTLVVNAKGKAEDAKKLNGKNIPFSDVEKDYWANGYISYAKENLNLLNGFPDGTFKPKDYIKNADVIKVLVQLKKNLKMDEVKAAKYPDDWMKWAKEEKIIEDDIDPKALANRGEIFEYLYNTLNKEEKVDVASLKETLKKIVDPMDFKVLEEKGIATKKNEKAIEELKAFVARAKELLAKEILDEKEIKELQEFTKFEGKKYRGTLSKLIRAVEADYELDGEKIVINKNNNKKYGMLKDNEFVIKTEIEGVKKIGESQDKYLKINYISASQYDEIDGMSESTPKYKKQELDKNLYTVEDKDGKVIVKIVGELPSDAVILKPVIYVKFGDKLYFENGTLLYVK